MEEKNANSVFRAKSLQRVSSPERTDDYLRRPTPNLWLTLAAILLLGGGALCWLTFGAI